MPWDPSFSIICVVEGDLTDRNPDPQSLVDLMKVPVKEYSSLEESEPV